MRGGELDKRMTVQQATDVQTTSGDITTTWADLWANVPCRVIYADASKASEKFEADRDTARTYIDFKIRWRSGLNQKMRIVYGSNNYDIVAISDLGRQEGIVLKAYNTY
jgi:SPP1 family predicted phage head-tail adaptor